MTIKELIEHQQQSGNICLIRQGLFFRAYNQGAVLLNSLLGYQIRCKNSKSCDTALYYVGFPSSVIDKVIAKIVEQGGVVVKHDNNYIECSGIEVCYDEYQLRETAVMSSSMSKREAAPLKSRQIAEAIRQFDTSNTKPVEALSFIAHLQDQLNALTA